MKICDGRGLWPQKSAEELGTARTLGALLLVPAVALLLGSAVASLPDAPSAPAPVTAPSPAPAPVGALPLPPAPPPAVRPVEIDAEAPPPRGLQVERLGIDTELVDLEVGSDGVLQVPEDFDLAGWHRGGTAPGDTGPAVLVGHVDSYEGPAVFHRLAELRPDDPVRVTRTDGSVVEFVVYGAETIPKDGFPTDRVYGDTSGPELRLLTCGGAFDEQARSYRDNVIVYARQATPAVVS